MAKRAASPASVTQHLPDSAQQHLRTLRGEIESRLATLEEVLADPSRGESLAGLILDLSRIATEEAQAAAAQVCHVFRSEADRQVAEQRAAAAAAIEAAQTGLRTAHEELETERATTQHLRHETEQAQVELGNLRELAAVKEAAREKAERELKALRETGARQKAAETDLKQQLESEQRATTDAQTLLNAERAIVADLRREAEQFHSEAARVTERLAALERVQADARAGYEREQAESHAAYERSLKDAAAAQEHALADARAVYERAQADARTAYDTIAQDLERERTAAAYAHAELQSQVDSLRTELDAERGQTSELRQAAQRAGELSATLEREKEAAAGLERAHAELQSQLDRQRADFERQLASQRAELDADRGQRTSLDAERGQSAQLRAELDAERDRHITLRAEFDAERSQQLQLRSELDAERSQNAELRRALQELEERGAVSPEGDELESRQLELAALSQAALTDAHKALAEAQADLQRERASNAELRQAVESNDQLLASSRSNEVQMLANVDQLSAQLQRERGQAMEVIEALKTERDRVAVELQAAQKWIDDVRAAEAEFTPKKSPAASGSKSTAKAATPPTPPPAVAPPPAAPKKEEPAAITLSDEGWQTIRLTNRYIYNDGVPIQVNGDAGTLFDLSFTGCQILSPSALKPNQLIKIQLSAKPPVSCSGKVVWTRLEAAVSAQLLSYRAGVRFTKADHAAIEAFAASHVPSSVVPDSDA